MKRGIPLFLTAFVGIIYVVQFFVPHRPFSGMQDLLTPTGSRSSPPSRSGSAH